MEKPKKLLSVDRADNCIYINDLRGRGKSIHLTKKQAISIGEALLEIATTKATKAKSALQNVTLY